MKEYTVTLPYLGPIKADKKGSLCFCVPVVTFTEVVLEEWCAMIAESAAPAGAGFTRESHQGKLSAPMQWQIKQIPYPDDPNGVVDVSAYLRDTPPNNVTETTVEQPGYEFTAGLAMTLLYPEVPGVVGKQFAIYRRESLSNSVLESTDILMDIIRDGVGRPSETVRDMLADWAILNALETFDASALRALQSLGYEMKLAEEEDSLVFGNGDRHPLVRKALAFALSVSRELALTSDMSAEAVTTQMARPRL